MSQLSKAVKLFSGITVGAGLGIYANGQIPIRTNVLRRNGYVPVEAFGGTSAGFIKTIDNRIETFYRIIDDCEEVEFYPITENIMRIFLNNIIGLIDENRNIVELKDPIETKRINNILKEQETLKMIKESIAPIIYYGSISYLKKCITYKGKKRMMLYDLKDPHSVIIRKNDLKTTYIIEGHRDVEVDQRNILYIGPGNFKLETPDPDFDIVDDENDSHIVASGVRYYASKPLYYTVTQKIKEYVLKDILATVLSLKDAVQPTFLTMNMEISRYGSTTSTFQSAAQEIESLINRSNDDAISMSQILQIDVLVNRILSSVRILPDPGGTLQNLNALNLDEIKDRLNRLREGMDELMNQIFDAVSIPRDLYDGSTNSYESMQKNDRLFAAIEFYLDSVKSAVKNLVISTIECIEPTIKLKPEDMKVTLFRKSPSEYSRDSKEMSSLRDSMDLSNSILTAAADTIDNNRFIDDKAYFKYVKTNLSNINKDIGDLIVSKMPKKQEDEL